MLKLVQDIDVQNICMKLNQNLSINESARVMTINRHWGLNVGYVTKIYTLSFSPFAFLVNKRTDTTYTHAIQVSEYLKSTDKNHRSTKHFTCITDTAFRNGENVGLCVFCVMLLAQLKEQGILKKIKWQVSPYKNYFPFWFPVEWLNYSTARQWIRPLLYILFFLMYIVFLSIKWLHFVFLTPVCCFLPCD